MGLKGRFGCEENAAENTEENAAGQSEAYANGPCHSPVCPSLRWVSTSADWGGLGGMGSAREDGGVSGVSSSCGARGGFLPRHDEDLREPLVPWQESHQQPILPGRG